MLPADLREAESQALAALLEALPSAARGRWSVDWRFEGLRLLPVVLRLCRSLLDAGLSPRIVFPDAGACALARRDAPDLAERIADFRSQQRRSTEAAGPDGGAEATAPLLLAVAPALPDYEDFEQLCAAHRGPVAMLNGRLEDAAVGIGSVARERRRGFVAEWQAAYFLQPLEGSALRRAYPGGWELYRQDADGFRLAARFDERPDAETQAQALAGEGGLGVGGNLRALDAFIEGLRS
ncbi:DUF1995 family protein [Cyanobium sp. CH-040]|uniref:DUF1995 family protein n=1 Tax=Cyanobium sp. CH-040 TaxID=2823708 RepID=UPI0020CE1CCC|nr:DUF1995 family protein [Cyanobium sp. CH-040]MCP9927013.1 DUF1995 family protein [Cyanobium sp. CH-040]